MNCYPVWSIFQDDKTSAAVDVTPQLFRTKKNILHNFPFQNCYQCPTYFSYKA